jgi:hypothetical protein
VNRTVRQISALVLIFVATRAFAGSVTCGPVPPGGMVDPKCHIKIAPPPIPYLNDTAKLIDLLKSEQIYFVGSDPNSLKWSGEIFWYGDATCFKIEEKTEMSGQATAKSAPCSETIKGRANLTPLKFEKIEEFKKKLTSCLKVKDVNCLRTLTSKSIQVSLGVEPPGDQAYLLYSKWKDSDFKKMLSLVENGLTCTNDKCEFPKKVSNEGMGLRGGVEKANGRWLLTYYLAGD